MIYYHHIIDENGYTKNIYKKMIKKKYWVNRDIENSNKEIFGYFLRRNVVLYVCKIIIKKSYKKSDVHHYYSFDLWISKKRESENINDNANTCVWRCEWFVKIYECYNVEIF